MPGMLAGSNHDRIETLIPLRHSRMLGSPFAFFRGSAIVQANDLAPRARNGCSLTAYGDIGGFGLGAHRLAANSAPSMTRSIPRSSRVEVFAA